MSSLPGGKPNIELETLKNKVSITEEITNVLVSVFGTQGPRGSMIVSGSANPVSSQGELGDIYLNTSNNSIWGPKFTDPADGLDKWGDEPFFQFTASRRFVHTQNSPSEIWLITHDLGGQPSIVIVDSAKTVVIGEVSYINGEEIEVRFSSPFSGFAYLT